MGSQKRQQKMGSEVQALERSKAGGKERKSPDESRVPLHVKPPSGWALPLLCCPHETQVFPAWQVLHWEPRLCIWGFERKGVDPAWVILFEIQNGQWCRILHRTPFLLCSLIIEFKIQNNEASHCDFVHGGGGVCDGAQWLFLIGLGDHIRSCT